MTEKIIPHWLSNQCKTCMYFDEFHIENDVSRYSEGECHRYPPVLDPNYHLQELNNGDVAASSLDIRSYLHVRVGSFDWCGEYKER